MGLKFNLFLSSWNFLLFFPAMLCVVLFFFKTRLSALHSHTTRHNNITQTTGKDRQTDGRNRILFRKVDVRKKGWFMLYEEFFQEKQGIANLTITAFD